MQGLKQVQGSRRHRRPKWNRRPRDPSEVLYAFCMWYLHVSCMQVRRRIIKQCFLLHRLKEVS